MTAASALALVEDELQSLDCDPDVWTALDTLRHSLVLVPQPKSAPKPTRKAKLHDAVKACERPVAWGQCSSGGFDSRKHSLQKWQEREYAAATSPETLKRIQNMPRSPQFDYDPPARMKDDERRVMIRALSA